MRLFILLSGLSGLLLSSGDCSTKKNTSAIYKGRLEVAGICSNYTIKVLEGAIDTSRIVTEWTDEMTGKSYTNVFRLDKPCNFPTSIKEGTEFYFSIDTSGSKGCIVCLAYYPTPPKKLAIRVEENPTSEKK